MAVEGTHIFRGSSSLMRLGYANHPSNRLPKYLPLCKSLITDPGNIFFEHLQFGKFFALPTSPLWSLSFCDLLVTPRSPLAIFLVTLLPPPKRIVYYLNSLLTSLFFFSCGIRVMSQPSCITTWVGWKSSLFVAIVAISQQIQDKFIFS